MYIHVGITSSKSGFLKCMAAKLKFPNDFKTPNLNIILECPIEKNEG